MLAWGQEIGGPKLRRLKMSCLAVLAVCVLGSAAAVSAIALPAVLLLGGEVGSLLLRSLTNTFIASLQTAISTYLGEGVLLVLHFPNAATNLGTYEYLILKMLETGSKETCHTPGDAEGEVLFPRREFHLVFDSLTVLGVAALILVPEFEFVCGNGTQKVKVKGSLLALLTPINTEVLVGGDFRFVMRCGKFGAAEETKFWNSSGVLQSTLFEANVGIGGFEQACLDIRGTVLLGTSRMAEIMG
jgi:hypothetical protein